jgi:hypothetical protein
MICGRRPSASPTTSTRRREKSRRRSRRARRRPVRRGRDRHHLTGCGQAPDRRVSPEQKTRRARHTGRLQRLFPWPSADRPSHHFDTLRGTDRGVPVQYLPEDLTRALLIRAGVYRQRTHQRQFQGCGIARRQRHDDAAPSADLGHGDHARGFGGRSEMATKACLAPARCLQTQRLLFTLPPR